jgi:hypothetical protein
VNESDLSSLKAELKKNIINSNTNEGGNPEDNMSMAELIAKKYRKNIKVNRIKTPEQAASVLIKSTKKFNVND